MENGKWKSENDYFIFAVGKNPAKKVIRYQLSVIRYNVLRPSALSRFRLSASATTCAISEAIQ